MTGRSVPIFDVPADLWIGGTWRDGSAGARTQVQDPATGEAVAEVASASPDDGRAAVAAAAEAATAWAATPPRERGEVLRRTFELMLEHRDQLVDLIVLEGGKSRADAVGEVTYAAEFYRWFAEEAVRATGQIGPAPGGGKHIVTLMQPVGVSVLITPWNFPAAMITRKVAPALAAGCTVVVKPAPETPLTALVLADLMARAGLPPGVLNVVPTDDAPTVVAAMMDHPATRKLSFTGSTQVGRILLRQAADRVLNCSMELGGNAPFLVFADADLDAAVDGAMVAKLRNAGESCIAANRFLVEEAVAEEFTSRLAERMGALRVGPGADADNDIGPMITARARDDIAGMVDASVAHGSSLRLGGTSPDRPGHFYDPTILADVAADDPILGLEVFGPVAPVVPFTSEDEAVALANDTPFGLAAYVYTGDLARAMRVGERIEAGMVGINRGLISDPAAPFGGVKQSGLGREGGHEGLLEFLEPKYIAVDWEA